MRRDRRPSARRAGQVEALGERHAELDQRSQLGLGLHALGHEQAVHAPCVVRQRADQRGSLAVDVDSLDERPVELQVARLHGHDLPEPGVAGPHVVDRHLRAAPAQRLDRRSQPLAVVHECVLGQLDDQPRQVGLSLEHAQRARVDQHGRRQVDRQGDAAGSAAVELERLAQARQFERLAFAELVGQREPLQRAARAVRTEARERLIRVDRAAAHVDDRLHDHREAVAVDHAAQRSACALTPVTAERTARVDGHLPATRHSLGDAQRDIGRAQQRLGALAVVRCARESHAGGDATRLRAFAGKLLDQARGECRRILARQQQCELIAAEPPGDRTRGHLRLQRLGERRQHLVAVCVAGGLVDRTEPVEIEQQQRQRRSLAGDRTCMVQRCAEGGSRKQTCQPVVVGVPARLAEQVVELDREAPDRQQQSDRRHAKARVFEAEPAFDHDRHRECPEHDRAADPVHAPAARHHAAGHGGQPEDAQHGDALPAEPDDQDRRRPGQRLLELQPHDALGPQVNDRGGHDRGKPGYAEPRPLQQPRLSRDQRDACDTDRGARPRSGVTRTPDVAVAFDRNHGADSVATPDGLTSCAARGPVASRFR